MDLVRDLLDKRVVDRRGREMGRVDGVVLAQRTGAAPHVEALEIGPAVLAARLHPALGRLVEGLEHALGLDRHALRVPIARVLSIGDLVKVDVAIGETPAAAVEERLRTWVRRVPGA